MTECFDWILAGKLNYYNDSITTDEQIAHDVDNPEDALLADQFDIFTLDTTIIATGLGQLMDEGTIDKQAKPFLLVAIKRQRNQKIGYYDAATLDAIARVVDEA